MGLTSRLSRFFWGAGGAEGKAHVEWLTNSGTLKGHLVSLDRVKRRIALRPVTHPGPVRQLRVLAGASLLGLHVGMRVCIGIEQWGDRVWVTSIEAVAP